MGYRAREPVHQAAVVGTKLPPGILFEEYAITETRLELGDGTLRG